jgi:hypothetical protein
MFSFQKPIQLVIAQREYNYLYLEHTFGDFNYWYIEIEPEKVMIQRIKIHKSESRLS